MLCVMLMCNTYICSFSVSVTYKRKTGHKGKKGTPPLSEGVPYEITLIRLSQVSLDRRRREKVIWEMITEHSCNPFADLEC